MACAKPPHPGSMTAPTPIRSPRGRSVHDQLRDAEKVIARHKAGGWIDNALKAAELSVRYARQAGLPAGEIAKLEAYLKNLKGQAHNREQQRIQRRDELNPFVSHPRYAAKRNVDTALAALTRDDHWASKSYRENLIRMIEGNQRIPDSYKARLHKDVARVLQIAPHAGGLVTELTLRGQRGATGGPSKLGSRGNSAIGSAYEIMGTAALSTMVSKAANGGPSLHINAGKDIVTFGDKSYLNGRQAGKGIWEGPSRKTVECDIRIGKPTLNGFLEIGVDFKHVREMGQKNSSADFKNQVGAVVNAIQHGHFHEYHFVTNGTFGPSFRAEIDAANKSLGRNIIGCHERVHTLVADPSAQG